MNVLLSALSLFCLGLIIYREASAVYQTKWLLLLVQTLGFVLGAGYMIAAESSTSPAFFRIGAHLLGGFCTEMTNCRGEGCMGCFFLTLLWGSAIGLEIAGRIFLWRTPSGLSENSNRLE